jgi:hypothetical protein
MSASSLVMNVSASIDQVVSSQDVSITNKPGKFRKLGASSKSKGRKGKQVSAKNNQESGESSIPNTPVAPTLRLSGKGGHSKSTIANNQYGVDHFNNFLLLKGFQFTVADSGEYADIICQKELFQEFGTYMSEYATIKVIVLYMLVRN